MVRWRLKARNIRTGESRNVWAVYSSKTKAIEVARAFNDTSEEVKWEVYREENNKKTRVF